MKRIFSLRMAFFAFIESKRLFLRTLPRRERIAFTVQRRSPWYIWCASTGVSIQKAVPYHFHRCSTQTELIIRIVSPLASSDMLCELLGKVKIKENKAFRYEVNLASFCFLNFEVSLELNFSLSKEADRASIPELSANFQSFRNSEVY